jgi:hypothetical protein
MELKKKALTHFELGLSTDFRQAALSPRRGPPRRGPVR